MPISQSLVDRVLGKKATAIFDRFSEETRDSVDKAFVPNWLYKPPFGYPAREEAKAHFYFDLFEIP